jgi:LuxR family maltose regulon positive regulatory protein
VQQLREHVAAMKMWRRCTVRASRWFAAEGYTEEAIRHALAAGDVADAVNILARVRHDLMKTAQWMELSHLLHLFPAHQIEREPELLLAQAWFARSQNNVALLQASVQLAICSVERS